MKTVQWQLYPSRRNTLPCLPSPPSLFSYPLLLYTLSPGPHRPPPSAQLGPFPITKPTMPLPFSLITSFCPFLTFIPIPPLLLWSFASYLVSFPSPLIWFLLLHALFFLKPFQVLVPRPFPKLNCPCSFPYISIYISISI